MKSGKRKIVIIVGTNASGKSSLAVTLAEKYNGEVISADSRQVYRGLDIATGKITEQEMQGIPHHLTDIASPKNKYTAADFAKDGQKVLQEIFERGRTPIIAGGTGFYIQSLLDPKTLPSIPPNQILRAKLEKQSVEELFQKLELIDPQRAKDLKLKNEQGHKRRIIRSIEIMTDKCLTKTPPCPEDSFGILWIGLSWSKEELENRIRERTLDRIRDGMIDEAKRLHNKGLSYKRMRELGLEYRHLADYLQHVISQDELIEHINIGDRQYAKRQRTWFKRNKEIHWFENDELKDIENLVDVFLR